MMTDRLTLTVLALVLSALVATGCGRRGSLDTPSQAARAAAQADKAAETEETKPDRPFILDGLIE